MVGKRPWPDGKLVFDTNWNGGFENRTGGPLTPGDATVPDTQKVFTVPLPL